MEKTGTHAVPVHTCVPGRARIRISGLKRNPGLKHALEQILAKQKETIRAAASTTTGNLLVCYSADLPIEILLVRIEAVCSRATDDIEFRIPGSEQEAGFGPSSNAWAGDQYWHRRSAARVLETFDTRSAAGLSAETAASKLQAEGANRLPETAKRSAWSMFVDQYKSLPAALLGGAVGLSIATGALFDAVVILGVLTSNALIGFVTERQSEQTIQKLQRSEIPPARILRSGKARYIPAEEIVTGDILILQPGTNVPADVRIIETRLLTIDESALTGENFPVEKSEKALKKKYLPLSEISNMAFMGTVVSSGYGKAVVVATGQRTVLGNMQSLLQSVRPPVPPIQNQMARTGSRLVTFSTGICAGVFAIGWLRGFSLLNNLRTSISLAAAAIPEGLPASVTTTFALGIRNMQKHGILIRNLSALETLGSVQVICFDKTGTITHNRMAVEAIFTGMKHIERGEDKVLRHEDEPITVHDLAELKQLLTIGALCSEVKLGSANGGKERELIGSPTENALVEVALDQNMDVKTLRKSYQLLEVNLRSEKSRIMSTLHAHPAGGMLHAVKGSPLEVLQSCAYQLKDGQVVELTDADRQTIRAENKRMAGRALRVLGTAIRTVAGKAAARKTNGFVWIGLIGMVDPIRPGVREAIAAFHRAGIETVMITGDQALTAETVARQLNLSQGAPLQLMDVNDLDSYTPEEMREQAGRVHVYSRLSPAHKLKIVQALQSANKVVAMTGDGINDGPALRAADVGIAIGDGGTDVARDVADVILARDHLNTMAEAVRHGRTTYGNIKKSIGFFLSTNFSEILLTSTSVAAGTGLPLSPMQLLWINTISDIFPGLALSLEPPEQELLTGAPRAPDAPMFSWSDYYRMLKGSSVITGHTLGVYGYGLLRHGYGARAATMAFHSLTLSQMLHTFTCRSETTSIFQRGRVPTNHWVNLAVYGSIGIHVLTMLTPGLRGVLGLSRLGLADTAITFGGALCAMICNDVVKTTGARQAQQGLPKGCGRVGCGIKKPRRYRQGWGEERDLRSRPLTGPAII